MHSAQVLVLLGFSAAGGPNLIVSTIRALAKQGGPLAELFAVLLLGGPYDDLRIFRSGYKPMITSSQSLAQVFPLSTVSFPKSLPREVFARELPTSLSSSAQAFPRSTVSFPVSPPLEVFVRNCPGDVYSERNTMQLSLPGDSEILYAATSGNHAVLDWMLLALMVTFSVGALMKVLVSIAPTTTIDEKAAPIRVGTKVRKLKVRSAPSALVFGSPRRRRRRKKGPMSYKASHVTPRPEVTVAPSLPVITNSVKPVSILPRSTFASNASFTMADTQLRKRSVPFVGHASIPFNDEQMRKLVTLDWTAIAEARRKAEEAQEAPSFAASSVFSLTIDSTFANVKSSCRF